jgi:hypothetical protein
MYSSQNKKNNNNKKKNREFGETKEKDRVLTKQTKQVFVIHYLAIFSL